MPRKMTGRFLCNDCYKAITVLLPIPLYGICKKVAKREDTSMRGITLAALHEYLPKHISEEEYKAVTELTERYYPPHKDEETKRYWEERLGLEEGEVRESVIKEREQHRRRRQRNKEEKKKKSGK